MTASHLPEEFEDWPHSPFEILGISEDDDLRTAKKAFARLIRTYRAESHPKEFQAIRDAFECCRRWLEMGLTSFQFVDADDVEDTGDTETVVRDPRFTEIDDLISGSSFDTAYSRLLEQRPQDEPVFKRLYWLLFVAPEIDSGRTPLSCLEDALKSNVTDDWLCDCYAWELRYRTLDLNEPTMLLERLEEGGWQILNLLRERWAAMLRNGHPKRPMADLVELENEIKPPKDVLTEARLAMAPFAASLKAEDFNLLSFSERIEQDMQNPFDRLHELDRVDYLAALQVERKGAEFQDIPEAWTRLALLNLTQPYEFCRNDLLSFFCDILDDPESFYIDVDTWGDDAQLRLGELHGLCNTAHLVEWDHGLETDEKLEQQVIDRFLKVHDSLLDYDEARPYIERFCLQEMIHPMAIHARKVELDGEFADDEWLNAFQEDTALQIVFIAHQVLNA